MMSSSLAGRPASNLNFGASPPSSVAKPKKVAFKLNAQMPAKPSRPALNRAPIINCNRSVGSLASTATATAAAAAGISKSPARRKVEFSDFTAVASASAVPPRSSEAASISLSKAKFSQDPMSQRYRYLNDGIIAQCRKWERLQDRAQALEKHKKTLNELRWKMALSGSSRKSTSMAK